MAAVDVFIVGAGPAGLAAALRLRQLGYAVALLERSKQWPRPQIGEALTPGVLSLFATLDAGKALAGVPQRPKVPVRISWRSQAVEAESYGESLLIERGAMDAALLTLAHECGVHVLQPAQLGAVTGSPGAWQIQVRRAPGTEEWSARFILDACGRHGNAASHIHTAPRMLACWAAFAPGAGFAPELLEMTHMAALEHGWLWGTCLPGQRYRLMLLCDPATPHKLMPGQPAAWLREQCRQSSVFAPLADLPFDGNFHAGCATPYFASDFWQPGRIKIGDCAFSLDPISTSGVEKAVRFALHAATAVHTLLRDEKQAPQELVHCFLRQRLLETCARHGLWAQRHYRQAWCAQAPFWQQRAAPFAAKTRDARAPAMALELQQEMEQLQDRLRQFHPPAPNHGPMLRAWQHVRFSAALQIVNLPCVVDERVQLRAALAHPHLERPLVILENEVLLPRLAIILQQTTLAVALDSLAPTMSMAKAQRILGWLWMHGLLESLD